MHLLLAYVRQTLRQRHLTPMKIYYWPGLISLLLLPVWVLLYLNQRGVFKKEAAIPIRCFLAQPSSQQENKSLIGPRLPERHFSEKFMLYAPQAAQFAELSAAIRRLNAMHDTLIGIQINMTDRATCQSLVSAIGAAMVLKLGDI